MYKTLYCFLLIIMLAFLTGCKREALTYSYLMQHPDSLKKEVLRCQSNAEKTNMQATQCEMVMSAAANFSALVEAQQSEPEKFGERIIAAQSACVSAKRAFEESQKSAMVRLSEIEKAYQAKCEEVAVLLAVVGLASPE